MSRPITKRYVAIVRGVPLERSRARGRAQTHVVKGTEKRAVFRLGKRHAGTCLHDGCSVELRAGHRLGPIIERVVMEPRGERWAYRWRQDFET